MGLFSEIVNSMVDAGVKNLEAKYRNMSDSELKREWRWMFDDRNYVRSNLYDSRSPAAFLDQEYSYRFHCKTWKQKCEEALKAEEESLKKKKEMEAENLNFENALPENPMVKDIIVQINKLAYDVYNISVNEDSIVCYDDSDNSIWTLKYRKYGYPDLNYDKMEILAKYIYEHLSLNYDLDGTELELVDAPGGMKTSW